MGYWGAGLFENDTATDVQGEYEEALEAGLDAVAATKQVLDSWRPMLEDVQDKPIIWTTLAAIQLEAERLLGVRVDVLTPKSLPQKFRDRVLLEAIPV